MEVKIVGLDIILDKLDKLSAKVEGIDQSHEDKWLDNEEFIHYLKISRKTAQVYRDNGLIIFSQIGAKIYYRLSEIDRFLEGHSIGRRK
jgi:hypothetical protein